METAAFNQLYKVHKLGCSIKWRTTGSEVGILQDTMDWNLICESMPLFTPCKHEILLNFLFFFFLSAQYSQQRQANLSSSLFTKKKKVCVSLWLCVFGWVSLYLQYFFCCLFSHQHETFFEAYTKLFYDGPLSRDISETKKTDFIERNQFEQLKSWSS